jgi:hypothetical protein
MVTRRSPDPAFPGSLAADQALDLDTALRVHTVNAAQATGLAQQTGHLSPGMSADFILLDRNVFDTPASRFMTLRSSRPGSPAVSSTTDHPPAEQKALRSPAAGSASRAGRDDGRLSRTDGGSCLRLNGLQALRTSRSIADGSFGGYRRLVLTPGAGGR